MPLIFSDYKLLATFATPVVSAFIFIRNSQANTKKTIANQEKLATEAAIRQEEWQKGVDKRLTDHDDRIDEHETKFSRMQTDFIPRIELDGKLAGILKITESTNEWVRMLLPALLHKQADVVHHTSLSLEKELKK